jgi:hypothetical protein
MQIKITFFRWFLSTYILWLRVFGNMPHSGIQHYWSIYMYIKNYAQELIPNIFGFQCDINRIRKYFLSELKFKPGSLGWMMDALVNSAIPQLSENFFLFDKQNTEGHVGIFRAPKRTTKCKKVVYWKFLKLCEYLIKNLGEKYFQWGITEGGGKRMWTENYYKNCVSQFKKCQLGVICIERSFFLTKKNVTIRTSRQRTIF